MDQGEKVFQSRLWFLIVGMLLWIILIIGKLVDIQVVKSSHFKAEAEGMHTTRREIPALRGQIMDTHGRTLAISLWEPSITADPKLIENAPETVAALAKALGEGETWVKTMLPRLSNPNVRFRYIERRTTEAKASAVKKLDLKGITVGRESWRKYPNEWIASHVLGFISQDEAQSEGVERIYNTYMQGQKGAMEVLRDARGRRNGMVEKLISAPKDGSSIQLTLDMTYQNFMEDAMRRSMAATHAESITGILMDPRTGAILAMANLPDFNPNGFKDAQPATRKNRATVDHYEPGSAFKIVTVAAGIDSGAVKPDQIFDCSNRLIAAGNRRIRNHEPFKMLDVPSILWYSSNSGVAQMAEAMGPKVFSQYIHAFGFGAKTKLDVPSETPGIMRQHADWYRNSHYFLAMGHEVSSTPIQMITALAAIANDGKIVRPYLAKAAVAPDGTVTDLRPTDPPRQVISKATADYMRAALEGVVMEGTAKRAAIHGIRVFGKTGTAQRQEANGTYARNKYNSSFVGFFPAEAPRYGMIVVVHDPKGPRLHGGDVAAPIFSEIGNRIMDLERAKAPVRELLVTSRSPNWSEEALPDPESPGVMPDLRGLGLRPLMKLAQRLGISVEIMGEGRVQAQSPLPGEPIPENRNCTVTLNEG